MGQEHMEEYAEKLKIADKFANNLVRVEDNIELVLSFVFDGFHDLGFERIRIYRYRDGKCFSWRCCDRHAREVKDLFEAEQVVLSVRSSEPDNFASMEEKIPLIVVYDPQCDSPGRREDEYSRHVFVTSTDPWYEKLDKPKIAKGKTFEWLDCPLLVGKRIWGKITMDRHSLGVCFRDTDLALTAPLSHIVASALERNPLYDYDVFISFDTSRRELAQTAAYFLEDRGLHTFIAPEAITAGQNFPQVIREGILRAKNILVLFSPECIGNDWVYAECSSSWILDKNNVTVFRVGGVKTAELPFFMRDTQSPEYSVERLINYAKEQADVKPDTG